MTDRLAETTEELAEKVRRHIDLGHYGYCQMGRPGRQECTCGFDERLHALTGLDTILARLDAATKRAEAAEADADKLAQALEQIAGFTVAGGAGNQPHFSTGREIARAALAARSNQEAT